MRPDRLYREQERLAKRAVLYDQFGEIRHIAGADCAYLDDRIIGGVVVLERETLEPVERAHVVRKLRFPYIPGLLAYREAGAMAAACKKLKTGVDLLMVDGFGTNHPRRCGLATHVGIKLGIPTIGVGKSFLCGEIKGDDVYQGEEKVGRLVHIPGRSKPVYVSPGHRISLETAVALASACTRAGKMPEPTRLAHEYATYIKQIFAEKAKIGRA